MNLWLRNYSQMLIMHDSSAANLPINNLSTSTSAAINKDKTTLRSNVGELYYNNLNIVIVHFQASLLSLHAQ